LNPQILQDILLAAVSLRALLRIVTISIACYRVALINEPKATTMTFIGFFIDMYFYEFDSK